MADYLDVIFWSLIGGLFSIGGGVLLLANRKSATALARSAAPFAAGALLGAAFFDLLPEAVEHTAEGAAFRWVVVGIVIFFLLERYLHWFHHHREHPHNETYLKATLIIIGDTLHNAIDGIAIGAAFLIGVPTGIVTTIAVAAHEIPQEIGDFGLLLGKGLKRGKVLLINALSALVTTIAAVATFSLGGGENFPLGVVLGLCAGLFIYIAASDLIPTIHQEAKDRFAGSAAILLIMGVLVVAVATEIAHERIHESAESGHLQKAAD